jgi:hypothetical protein
MSTRKPTEPKKTKAMIIKEQFDILAAEMDKQDYYYKTVRDFVAKHGPDQLPEEHIKGWLCARLQGPKSWREIPKMVKTIHKAAKKAAENIIKARA